MRLSERGKIIQFIEVLGGTPSDPIKDHEENITAEVRELEEQLDKCAKFFEGDNSMMAKLEAVKKKYYELLYAVETKHAKETRYETALRYIQERENIRTEGQAVNRIQEANDENK